MDEPVQRPPLKDLKSVVAAEMDGLGGYRLVAPVASRF